MPEKPKKKVNFPLIIFLVTLGLLTPKLLYLKQVEHKDTISKHNMATKDYVGLYELGGTIAGLQSGETLTLRNNEEKINISLNGEFFFKKRLDHNATYEIQVAQQPKKQRCYVINGVSQSKIIRSDVLTVRVFCFDRDNLTAE